MKTQVLFLLLSAALHYTSFAQVTVEKQNGEWSLYVNNEPFEVKGATFGYDKDVANYDQYFEELKYLGVNTIRTWGTGENTPQLLDAADKQGIKVMLGIWMRHGRPGMEADDSFDYLTDEEGKQAMYDNAISIVKRYKDHPAILTWGIGNEVYLNMATDEEKLAYSQLLQKIGSEIKTLDPGHPITSVEAWIFGVDWWSEHVPSIDIYGLNVYGAGASVLVQELAKKGVDKPYVITEFGVRGEWEIEEDENGVKPEPSDQEKYETIVNGYRDWIRDEPQCLGVYVFHYSDDSRFLGPWLLTHFRGKRRPQYWAIREAYTGRTAEKEVPVITSLNLPEDTLSSGTWIPVEIAVKNKEQEALDVSFYYNQRTGSRVRRDQLLALNQRGSLAEGLEVQLPLEHGGIKIYAAVSDAANNVGIASSSISVIDKEKASRKYLVPSVSLPFKVYEDGGELPYAMSAYMGNYAAIEVDLNHTKHVHSGQSAIKIRYNSKNDWYGVGFVNPANDWGDILGGYDVSGAKTMSFWAKASYDQLKVTAGYGLIKEDKTYPDTSIKHRELMLTDQWTQYTIKIKKADLSCIRSGFVLFSAGEGLSHTIYIDDIVFE